MFAGLCHITAVKKCYVERTVPPLLGVRCMVIANGRVGADATHGEVTCKDVSLVNYVICSPKLLQHIT